MPGWLSANPRTTRFRAAASSRAFASPEPNSDRTLSNISLAHAIGGSDRVPILIVFPGSAGHPAAHGPRHVGTCRMRACNLRAWKRFARIARTLPIAAGPLGSTCRRVPGPRPDPDRTWLRLDGEDLRTSPGLRFQGPRQSW